MASKLSAVVDDLVKGNDASLPVAGLTDHDILLMILMLLARRIA